MWYVGLSCMCTYKNLCYYTFYCCMTVEIRAFWKYISINLGNQTTIPWGSSKEPLIFYKKDKGKLDEPFYYCPLDFAFAVVFLLWNNMEHITYCHCQGVRMIARRKSWTSPSQVRAHQLQEVQVVKVHDKIVIMTSWMEWNRILTMSFIFLKRLQYQWKLIVSTFMYFIQVWWKERGKMKE